MIDLELLEKLVAFAKYGTLSKVAEELHISQPALSRSMKNIEDQLNVTLFTRTKNQMALTETGKYAAEHAEILLNQADEFEKAVHRFDTSLKTINIGYCSTIPQIILSPLVSQYYSNQTIVSSMKDDSDFLELLQNDELQLAVLHKDVKDSNFYTKKCGSESLFLSVSPSSTFAFYPEIQFKDIDGTPIIIFQNIGFWENAVKEKLPKSLFISQSQTEAFQELLKSSDIASFTSSYFIDNNLTMDHRINIPITDPEAKTNFYLVCLAKNKSRFSQLFDAVHSHTIH